MKMWRAVPLMLLLAPGVASAQAEFAGRWKFDPTTAKLPAKPEVILLQNGTYTCSTCVPAIQVVADGRPHAIAPSPYSDMAAMTVVDANTVQGVRMKGGVVTGRMSETVAPDGQTMVLKFDDMTVPASPVTGQISYARLAPGPAGSHAISGQWRQSAIGGLSEDGLYTDIKVDGSNVTLSSPSGQSYTAQLDGPQAPYSGDPGITTVALARGGPRTLVETDYRNGTPISVSHMTVSADGRTVVVTTDDKLRNTTSSATLIKQ